MSLIGTPSQTADRGWLTRYLESVEYDLSGRRVFRFHRRFPHPPIEAVDVQFAVSVAVAVLALSVSVSFDVEHIELYLRPDDAFRLGPQLHGDTNWPAWGSAAELVHGEPEGDADLTVVLVGAIDAARTARSLLTGSRHRRHRLARHTVRSTRPTQNASMVARVHLATGSLCRRAPL